MLLRASLLSLAVFFGAGRLYSVTHTCAEAAGSVHETYDPSLRNIRNLDDAEAFVRGDIPQNASETEVANAIDAFVRRRFYHGYSTTHLCNEDWIASIAGLAWYRLGHPVDPDEILQHSDAYCGQQTPVFTALAHRFGLHYRFVRIGVRPGAKSGGIHMAPAVLVGGQWRLYDPDLEIKNGSIPLSSFLNLTAVSAYPPSLGEDWQAEFTHEIKLGMVDADQPDHNRGARGIAADQIMLWLSKYGWVLFLFLALGVHSLHGRKVKYRLLDRRSSDGEADTESPRPDPPNVEHVVVGSGCLSEPGRIDCSDVAVGDGERRARCTSAG